MRLGTLLGDITFDMNSLRNRSNLGAEQYLAFYKIIAQVTVLIIGGHTPYLTVS